MTQKEMMMNEITVRTSLCHFKHGNRFAKPPKWIVVHYTGTANASAANCEKSISKLSSSKIASTHFIVDEHEIIACVHEKYIAWHCCNGQCKQPDKSKPLSILSLKELSSIYAHDWRYELAANNHIQWQAKNDDFKGNCMSLGVDLCVKKQSTKSKSATDCDWFFEDETIKNAAKLIAYLCKKYHIDIDHVIRHADATGKPCPRPFVSLPNDCDIKGGHFYDNMWNIFKEMIGDYIEEGVAVTSFHDDLKRLAQYENQ